MRNQRERHCPPTDIDIWVMVFAFGVLAYPAHCVNTVQKRRKLDRPAQGTVGTLPAVEVGQCGIYLLIR
jgi:hypothetical protein